MRKEKVTVADTNEEPLLPLDDQLKVRYNGNEHLVDSIVQVRRTKGGASHFKLAMCCLCCKGTTVWHSKGFLEANACKALIDLASQAEEFSHVGVDIQSQMTSEGGSEDEKSENQFPELDFDGLIDAGEALGEKMQMRAPQIASLELAGAKADPYKELVAVEFDLKKNVSLL